MCSTIDAIQRRLKPVSPSRHTMNTIDEMLHLALLTPDQHDKISAWIAQSNSPEEILKMPPALWRAIERASEVMGIDNDLLRPPALDAEGVFPG